MNQKHRLSYIDPLYVILSDFLSKTGTSCFCLKMQAGTTLDRALGGNRVSVIFFFSGHVTAPIEITEG